MKKILIIILILSIIGGCSYFISIYMSGLPKTVFIDGQKITTTEEELSEDIEDEFADASSKLSKAKPLNELDKTCWSRNIEKGKEIILFSKMMDSNKTIISVYNYIDDELKTSMRYEYKLGDKEINLYDLETKAFVTKKDCFKENNILHYNNSKYTSDDFANYEIGE